MILLVAIPLVETPPAAATTATSAAVAVASTESPETIICTKLIECMSLICTSTSTKLHVSRVLHSRARRLNKQHSTQIAHASLSKKHRCSDPQTQAACECPEVPQGGCPDGQACNVGLQDGSYVCGNTDGTLPTDAPVCDQQNPCEEGSLCILTSQGATQGSCLQTCER